MAVTWHLAWEGTHRALDSLLATLPCVLCCLFFHKPLDISLQLSPCRKRSSSSPAAVPRGG